MSTTTPRSIPKILIADDDPGISSAVGMRLKSLDVELLSAFFGEQAVWLAVTERPDVIITDMRMPSGDGDFVVECLKGRVDTSDIPVIVLTGRKDAKLKRRMYSLGVECYLHKPLELDALLDAVAEHVPLAHCV